MCKCEDGDMGKFGDGPRAGMLEWADAKLWDVIMADGQREMVMNEAVVDRAWVSEEDDEWDDVSDAASDAWRVVSRTAELVA